MSSCCNRSNFRFWRDPDAGRPSPLMAAQRTYLIRQRRLRTVSLYRLRRSRLARTSTMIP